MRLTYDEVIEIIDNNRGGKPIDWFPEMKQLLIFGKDCNRTYKKRGEGIFGDLEVDIDCLVIEEEEIGIIISEEQEDEMFECEWCKVGDSFVSAWTLMQ